ncbi:hypothetical protein ACFVFS_38540 [Kitasatospora sp. NPDC057692]|uniref:hypothetical protein n=1 Tax=Kitasatospora sp. NPDC057692 TaxID=3346215 RepID=UPI0036C6C79C
MNGFSRLFSNGDLDNSLRQRLGQISNKIAGINEDALLTRPEADLIEQLFEDFRVEAPVLDRASIVAEPAAEGYSTAMQFGEQVRIKQTVVTISVPCTGERNVFTLKPNTWTTVFPTATVTDSELRISWSGQSADGAAIQQALNSQLDTIERWLGWASAQITAFNSQAMSIIIAEVKARKNTILANRNLDAAIGFPIRKRPDASTYAIPVTRKKIDLGSRRVANVPFKPEPALADAHYEEVLRILHHSRNQLERSPSMHQHLDEQGIRDLLLLNLNGQLEGAAAGEVFNGKGKTDILIRVDDRHVFIGECKFWKGPKTITDTLDQLLSYLVWRDTKAALLLFVRQGNLSDIIPKALVKFREHPNFKREAVHATEFGERYNFVFHANDDQSREIKLAFLPFTLTPPAS